MREPAIFGRGDEGKGEEQERNGFRASLDGASLPDLIQMECLSHTEGSFRVISSGKVGYLFFRRGRLEHALVDDRAGEAAALEILEWQRGTFEPCRLDWPETPAIQSGWQNLLISAARAQDELGRRRLSAVPDAAAPSATSENARSRTPPPKPSRGLPALTALTQGGGIARAPSAPRPNGDLTSVPPALASQTFVRLDAAGVQISGRGNTEELAQVASYAARLSELIGDALGMSGFAGLEATHEGGRYLLHAEGQGLVAISASLSADLGPIRRKLDL
jgi:hypothetical protein